MAVTIAFVVTGIVVVAVVGQLLARSGRKYVGSDTRQDAGSVATLVTVVFHLVTLGFVALISVIPLGDDYRGFLLRLGLLLLILGIAYAVAVTTLGRRREVEVAEAAAVADHTTAHPHRPVVQRASDGHAARAEPSAAHAEPAADRAAPAGRTSGHASGRAGEEDPFAPPPGSAGAPRPAERVFDPPGQQATPAGPAADDPWAGERPPS